MSAEWISTTWGEIASLEYGKAIRDYQNADGAYIVYGTNGPIGKHHTPLCNYPSVIVGRKGAYRGIHYSAKPFFVIDTAFYLKPKVKLNTKWAYYCLLTYDINGMDSGSAIPSTSRDEFYKLPVLLPSENECNQIAEYLTAFDDRIALLRETNATLEAMAQALFKSWFVDFDPVHANAGTRAATLPTELQALFPSTFIDTPQGPAPEGWRFGRIYDVASVTYGAPFASKQFNTEQRGQPLIRIRDLKDEKPGVYTEEVHPKGYLTQPGDIVVGMDGEFRAYLWGGEPAWLNQRVCVFKPRAGYSSAFVNYTIKPQLAAVEATEIATTVIHLGKNDIDRFVALIPREPVLSAFSEVANPIFAQIVEGKQKAQTLAALRDTLLPRLIAGTLRLPDAAAALAEAGA